MTFDIDTKTPISLRDLPADSYYIRVSVLRKGIDNARLYGYIRKRTDDPFWSETYFGTRVGSYPSERVYRVTPIFMA